MKFKIVLFSLFCIVFSVRLDAQGKTEMKDRDKLNDINLLIEDKSYFRAIPLAKELAEANKENSHFNYLAGYCIYFENNNRKEAIPYLERAITSVSKAYNRYLFSEVNAPIEAYYYLAKCYQIDYKLDNAIFHYKLFLEKTNKRNSYKDDAKRQIDNCHYAKELIKSPVRLDVENLGDSINSPFSEFSPVISLDEKTLFFTSRRLRKDSSNYYFRDYKDGGYFEDIYYSKKDDFGKWSESKLVDFSRKDNHEATLNLKPDGKVLYVFRDDKGDGNLYESEFDEESKVWMEPGRIIGSRINTKFHETHLTITEDERTMYFVSDRDEGQGGKDIYRVVILPDDEWSKPLNLGPTINTPEDEDGPFISPDGKTLYFSSNGHKGMGGYDIFYSELSDSAGWSKPKNMEYPINSTDDDAFFVVSKDGHRAYYSSLQNKGGFGEKDIYMINHLEATKRELALVKGLVITSSSVPFPKDVDILVREIKSGEMRQLSKPQPHNGTFVFLVLPGFEYNVTFRRGEVEVFNENVFIEYETTFRETGEVIPLGPVDVRTEEEKKADQETNRAGVLGAGNNVDVKLAESTASSSDQNNNKKTKNGLLFKVQIGAFLSDDKVSIDKVYKVLTDYEEIKDGKTTTFVTGSYDTYEEAAKFKDQIRRLGIADAFVVAYKGDEKIDISKAIRLSNKK